MLNVRICFAVEMLFSVALGTSSQIKHGETSCLILNNAIIKNMNEKTPCRNMFTFEDVATDFSLFFMLGLVIVCIGYMNVDKCITIIMCMYMIEYAYRILETTMILGYFRIQINPYFRVFIGAIEKRETRILISSEYISDTEAEPKGKHGETSCLILNNAIIKNMNEKTEDVATDFSMFFMLGLVIVCIGYMNVDKCITIICFAVEIEF
ncbi:hypothetical protein ACJX0J_042152 [Zea mays]